VTAGARERRYGSGVGIDAIAVIKVPFDRVDTGASFAPVGADATACFLGVPFATEPAQLALFAAQAFGASLARHDDARGVLIVPSSAWGGDLASYDAVVEHFGEAGEWVPKLDPAQIAEQANAQLQSMMGAGLDAQLGAFQSMLQQNPEVAAAAKSMAEQLAGGGMPGGMEDMLAAAQAMLAKMTPEQRAAIEQMAQGAFGQPPDDDDE
jgi:hypothetical protein